MNNHLGVNLKPRKFLRTFNLLQKPFKAQATENCLIWSIKNPDQSKLQHKVERDEELQVFLGKNYAEHDSKDFNLIALAECLISRCKGRTSNLCRQFITLKRRSHNNVRRYQLLKTNWL